MYASFNSIAFFYYRQFDVLVWSWFSHYDLKDIFFVYDLKDPAHFMITIQDIELFPEWMKIIDYYFTSCKRDDQLNIGCVHSCRQAGRQAQPTNSMTKKKSKLYNSHGASQLALKSIVVFVSFLFSCRDFVSIWPSYFIKACALALTLINHTIVFNSIDQ